MLSYIFIELFCIVTLCTVDALKQEKICASCKFFTNKNDILLCGKCLLFPKIEINSKYKPNTNPIQLLVSGIEKPKEIDYYHCSTARGFKDMCGDAGTKYEEREE